MRKGRWKEREPVTSKGEQREEKVRVEGKVKGKRGRRKERETITSKGEQSGG